MLVCSHVSCMGRLHEYEIAQGRRGETGRHVFGNKTLELLLSTIIEQSVMIGRWVNKLGFCRDGHILCVLATARTRYTKGIY